MERNTYPLATVTTTTKCEVNDMETNRQWLNSLTDKQLAEFFTHGLMVTSMHYIGVLPFPISIRQIAGSYTQSTTGIEKWLSMPQDYRVEKGE